MARQVVALIDADIAAYKAAFISTESYDFQGDGQLAVALDEESCRDKCDEYVAKVVEATGATKVIICLSDPDNNWRKEFDPTYKAVREPKEKPALLALAKHYMASRYQSFIRPRLEADDVMGILSTSGDRFIKGTKIIVSEDKDMRTIPGLLYAPHRHSLGVQEISDLDADRFHMYQAVTGDITDGVTGCPNAGPKAAEDIIFADREDLWDMVLFEYQSRGYTEDDAVRQARLVHILRATDYNHKTKKVRLWNPLWLVRSDL